MMRTYLHGLRARRTAEAFCRHHGPENQVVSSQVFAREPGRWVVRVFCGQREFTDLKLPLWRSCRIIAVYKATGDAQELLDEEPYRPVLR